MMSLRLNLLGVGCIVVGCLGVVGAAQVAGEVEARGHDDGRDLRVAGPGEKFVVYHGAIDAAEFAEVAVQLDEPEDAAQVHHVEVEEVRGGDGIRDGAVVVARADGMQMLVGGGDELQVRVDVVGCAAPRGLEMGTAGGSASRKNPARLAATGSRLCGCPCVLLPLTLSNPPVNGSASNSALNWT
jgi:hypothetical protein